MPARDVFIQSLYDEIEGRRVSRDNPVHQRLIAGEFTREMLQEWGRQQWIFTRAFPGFLCLLAGNAPDAASRARVLAIAYQFQTGRPADEQSSLARWETVCAAFGLTRADLVAARPLPALEAMLATQELMARRSFVEGVAGLLIASREAAGQPLLDRRNAMAAQYHLPASALAYFDAQARAAPPTENMELVARYATADDQQELARQALRRVLNARWEYYSALGRAFGWQVP